MPPREREIILGIGGGIAAYKSADLLRRLQDRGFLITVIPTRSSSNFVGKATWEALSGREVPDNLWNNVHSVPHISLARAAAHLIIAPATADLLGKCAHGLADDLLTNVALSIGSPITFIPAMHPEMWGNSAVQENVATLRARGHLVIEPDVGRLTGSDEGAGRFPTSERIVTEFSEFIGNRGDLLGKRVLVSAGGTREAIDPVRFIGNRSSGKQGYAIAEAARQRGAEVTVLSANVNLPDIEGVKTIHVESARDMQTSLLAEFKSADILFMAAAVADARVKDQSGEKIAKAEFSTLELVENPDIVALAGASKSDSQIIVAFAAETLENGRERAASKMAAKNADFIYYNDVRGGAIFNSEMTHGTLLGLDGSSVDFSSITKDTLAHYLLDHAIHKLG